MAIVLALAIANDSPDPFLTTLLMWLGIQFGPAIYLFADSEPGRPLNLVVAVLLATAIVLALTPGRFTLLPYYHQILLMGAIVSGLAIAVYNLPSHRRSSRTRRGVLLGILLLGPMVSAAIWLTLLSGPIVAFHAARAANGQPSCTLAYRTRLNGLGDYKQVTGVWDLQAYRMTVPFTSAGGSGSFQFGFHGLLLTPGELFNWSYQSQRFERVTETARRNLGLRGLSCGS